MSRRSVSSPAPSILGSSRACPVPALEAAVSPSNPVRVSENGA